MNEICSKLPMDIVHDILSYDDHYLIRNGELVGRISKKDLRCDKLKNIKQKIYDSYSDFNTVFLKINEKKSICIVSHYIYHQGLLYKPVPVITVFIYELHQNIKKPISVNTVHI
jgi:hypothetical protein